MQAEGSEEGFANGRTGASLWMCSLRVFVDGEGRKVVSASGLFESGEEGEWTWRSVISQIETDINESVR
jgi:hypothetical protein